MSKPKKSKFDKIFKILKINENFTTKDKQVFDKVKDITYPQRGFNYMADILVMPTTSKGNKYILSIVDLWSNHIDIEPMKSKSAKATLDALLTIFKRKYLKNKHLVSIKTDNGGEFKESFDQWMKKNRIAHPRNLPDRHSQMSSVENLNRQVGRVLNTYMTNKEQKLGKTFRDWDTIINVVRDELNELKTHPKNEDPVLYPIKQTNVETLPKYAVGDIVYRPLEKPEKGQFGKFRVGDNRYDLVPRKISNIYLYTNNWRYRLDGFPNVSYAENELKASNDEVEKWIVESIRDKRTRNKQIEYLIKWKGFTVKESTWEPKDKLIEDGFEQEINAFEKNPKKKK